jgi:hypothetical protein
MEHTFGLECEKQGAFGVGGLEGISFIYFGKGFFSGKQQGTKFWITM